ncbi:28S ribosomal protein S36, mitochondrial-like isoform X1 [Limulus polyphemus]|uniref:28S ribosomal protein S36, mitochondrial-like isoform X1 n=1 Tax=Limulus polyphemus TaxID=6850 RepID=A0ABM1BBQ2_LIMPO|nr:28S ribosomal protein S36, mitochondrial-like isoform X1 [Limulus polyphemus]
MASNVARSWKVVKPHLPRIKFRKGGRPDSCVSGLATEQNPTLAKSSSQPSSIRPSTLSVPGTGIEECELPQRYARQQISQLELEYIERGGPE